MQVKAQLEAIIQEGASFDATSPLIARVQEAASATRKGQQTPPGSRVGMRVLHAVKE